MDMRSASHRARQKALSHCIQYRIADVYTVGEHNPDATFIR